MRVTPLAVLLIGLGLSFAAHARRDDAALYFVRAEAKTSKERTLISMAGVAIDGVFSDSVTFIATDEEINRLKTANRKLEIVPLPAMNSIDDFPAGDAAFHNHAETLAELDALATAYPQVVTRISIGKSLEGRDLAGVRISTNPDSDSLPTLILVGCHHAREHLSVEVPLMAARHLASTFATDARTRRLLETREVWIVPMLNPDGAEHDIASGSYRYWRKNRKDNGDGTYGVDLNRNYAKGFGGDGSSSSTSSDIYHGPSAFSEPETAALRDFLRERDKATVLISFHTFSELVLWPWGHTEEELSNPTDKLVFETMGKKMAEWNGYTPQKSSDLYVASGDTTDWAYDELGIFAYTFELSPSSFFGGGFYPGAVAIEPTFRANVEPVMYLLDKAENPYQVLDGSSDPLGIL